MHFTSSFLSFSFSRSFLFLLSSFCLSTSVFALPSLSIVSHDGTEIFQCVVDTDNCFDLNVQLSRDLAWDSNKRSWRWHKTWRVPDCLVTANANALHGIADLEAHLFVVCQADRPHLLEDAGIQSLDHSARHASLQLVDGRCRFSRLRLVATTSTFGGRMFHFVISIVRRVGDSVTVLASLISTAFAVYSRKNADKKRKVIDREAMMSGRWSEGYSFVPFPPKELDRKFIKKTTNADGVLVEEEITNSWEGLLAYFQAPNIRFKIRHPLFLAIRFSNILVILRDSLRFPQENEDALRSFICSCGFPLNCVRDPAVMIGHGEFLPPWLIAFRKTSMSNCKAETAQKLSDLMKVVKGPALGFVPDDSLLPQRYSHTFDVDNLGKLYTKLYAIEFAAGVGVVMDSDDNIVRDDVSSGCSKRAKTKMEPEEGVDPSIRTQPNCASSCGGDRSENDVNGTEKTDGVSSSSTQKTSDRMRSSFEGYFIALHKELRGLLQTVVELVSECVANPDSHVLENLRIAYEDFTEALSVHAMIEEHVLFKSLAVKVPKVTESYSVDHVIEQGRMEEISNIMRHVDPKRITGLFLKISELAALHNNHMDKEEHHLLPYFLDNFDDTEIIELIEQCRTMIKHLQNQHERDKDRADTKINLQNPRHQNAIERALMATGVIDADSETVEPPDNVHDFEFFSEGQTSGDGKIESALIDAVDLQGHSTPRDNDFFVSGLSNGNIPSPISRDGDDVIALIEEMYS